MRKGAETLDAFVKKQENPNSEVIVKVKNINMETAYELLKMQTDAGLYDLCGIK